MFFGFDKMHLPNNRIVLLNHAKGIWEDRADIDILAIFREEFDRVNTEADEQQP